MKYGIITLLAILLVAPSVYAYDPLNLSVNFYDENGNELSNNPIRYNLINSTDTAYYGFEEKFKNGSITYQEYICDNDISTAGYTLSGTHTAYAYISMPQSNFTFNFKVREQVKIEIFNFLTSSWETIYNAYKSTPYTGSVIINNSNNQYDTEIKMTTGAGLGTIWELWVEDMSQPVHISSNSTTLPLGTITATADDIDILDTHSESSQIVNISNNSINHLNFYLISNSNVVQSTFVIVDSINKQSLSGVLVSGQTTIDGVLTTITQKYTDDAGIVTLNLVSGKSHTITYSLAGYESLSDTIVPQEEIYNKIMTADYSLNYSNFLESIEYYFLPEDNLINQSGITNLNFTIYDSRHKIENITFNVSWNNTNYNEVSSTAINGTTLNIPFNSTNKSGYVLVTGYVEFDNNSIYVTKKYNIDVIDPMGYTLLNLEEYIRSRSSGEIRIYGLIIFVFIALFVGALSRISPIGAVLSGVVLCGMFLVGVGIVTGFQLTLMFILAIVLLLIFRGVS